MSTLRSALDELRVRDLAGLCDDELISGLDEFEHADRAIEAGRARWLAEVDRRGSFALDGHLSISSWLADRHRLSHSSAAAHVRLARALEHMPRHGGGARRGRHLAVRGGAAGVGARGGARGLLTLRGTTPRRRSRVARVGARPGRRPLATGGGERRRGAQVPGARPSRVEDARRHGPRGRGSRSRVWPARDHGAACGDGCGRAERTGRPDPGPASSRRARADLPVVARPVLSGRASAANVRTWW